MKELFGIVIGGMLLGVFFIACFLLGEATAQTPRPDVTLQEISPGVFEMRCMSPPDADMDLICFSKIDPDPPRLLGCVDAGPSEVVSITFSLTENSLIRCYAIDSEDPPLTGDLSLNAGLAYIAVATATPSPTVTATPTVPPTPPGRPYVVE